MTTLLNLQAVHTVLKLTIVFVDQVHLKVRLFRHLELQQHMKRQPALDLQ